MTDPFHADNDATPLSPEEREGLIPTHVALRSELNELEQQNIAQADSWAFRRKRNVLDDALLKSLHRRMFGRVWRWAGEFRTTGKNVGVDALRIETELHQIVEDAKYWVDHQSFSPDELAVRFHHRLVLAHPFPNGNGRWSRLAADMLITQLGGARFSWGRANLQNAGDVRRAYIDALHAADIHDLTPLIAFARS